MNATPLSQAAFGAACALIAALALVAARRRGETFPFFMGALVWALAVACKVAAHAALGLLFWVAADEDTLYTVWASALFGASSAFWELGATVAYLLLVRRNSHTVKSMVFFGLGAGALEAFIFGAVPLALSGLAPETGTRPLVMGAFVVAERLITALGHVTSRVLVFSGLRAPGRPRPARWALPAAFLLFGFVDGFAGYVAAPGRWDFDLPYHYGLLLLIVLGVTVVEAGLAWIALWRSEVQSAKSDVKSRPKSEVQSHES